jgi:hypothetical protein
MRDRMLAVIRGREVDRVPFVQYDGAAGPTAEIWEAYGKDKVGVSRWVSPHRIEAPNCRWESDPFEKDGLSGVRRTLHTPRGSLSDEVLFQPTLGAGATRKHFVKEPEDYDILAAYLEDIVVLDNNDEIRQCIADLGPDGIPHVAIDRTPWQQLWIQWVCVEDLCLHMVDCPDRVEQCVSRITRNARRTFELAARSPAPYIVFPDNITAPVIGERYFREYCVPLYDELAGMLAERDIPVFVHMDGDLKPLWAAIRESAVRGIDSLSPPPDNDTSVADALREWPDTSLLVNFPSSVHLASAEGVYERACEILAQGASSHRLQIQISENVPPGEWRRTFPAIIRAIEDFGRP